MFLLIMRQRDGMVRTDPKPTVSSYRGGPLGKDLAAAAGRPELGHEVTAAPRGVASEARALE